MDDDTLAVSELPLLSPEEQAALNLAGGGPAFGPVASPLPGASKVGP